MGRRALRHMGIGHVMYGDYGASFEVAQSIHRRNSYPLQSSVVHVLEFSGACIRMDRDLGF